MERRTTVTISFEPRRADRSAKFWGDRHPWLFNLAMLGLLSIPLCLFVLASLFAQGLI